MARRLQWARAGKTEDGWFELQRIRIGDYRILVVGSLRGFDPPAIAIMDQIAEQLARDALILGGFDCLLVRTANPDGLKHRSVTTSNGLELRHAFPLNREFKLSDSEDFPAEVVFLARLLKQFQPQRVIVVGQSDGSAGGIVYSAGIKDEARRFAEAVDLPDYSLARREHNGTFERFVADSGADVISVQLPGSTTVESSWSRFGIWLPSLLVQDSEQSPETADPGAVKNSD
jgi:hypothetical protein